MTDTLEEPDRLYSVTDAAMRLGTSAEYLRRLVRQDQIAHVRLGRKIMFRPAHLSAFIDAHERS